MASISQKEYLKRYLSKGSKDKIKKKKKPKPTGQGIKIIDDDLELSRMRPIDNADLDIFGNPEDAPQVVGVIDDMPAIVKTEDFTSDKWRLLNEDDGFNSKITIQQDKMKFRPIGADSDSDLSPPRTERSQRPPKFKEEKNKLNKHKRSIKKGSDSDLSPPRNRNNDDSDLSPPRKIKNEDSDLSPPRKRNNSDSDLSPPRNKGNSSPVRRNISDSHRSHRDNYDNRAPFRNRENSYSSPPRNRSRNNSSRSSNVKYGKNGSNTSSSQSQKLKRKNNSDSDLSPDRESTKNDRDKGDRRHRPDNSQRKSRWDNDRDDKHSESPSKEQKTLEGKKAGLQDASQLRKETEEFRKKEALKFASLSDDITGKNSKTVLRTIRGKKETEEDIAKKLAAEAKQRELEKKYERWGKGVKQVQERDERIQELVGAASKPLARYRDDEDLEKHLKDKERVEDPMYLYFKKKRTTGEEAPKEIIPIYQGAYPTNRFNIRPGYRWDGVDRSNGYEKRYFVIQNTKDAQQEETYRWCTEDM